MKIRLGYVAIALNLDKVTSSSTLTYSRYEKINSDSERINKLKEITSSNVSALEKISWSFSSGRFSKLPLIKEDICSSVTVIWIFNLFSIYFYLLKLNFYSHLSNSSTVKFSKSSS